MKMNSKIVSALACAALVLVLCAGTARGQRPILEVDVVATDANDGFLGLSEVATANLATNTIARVKGQTTPGDGGGGTYRWTGAAWVLYLNEDYAPAATTPTSAELATLSAEVAEDPRIPFLAKVTSRAADMNNPLYVGASFNHVTLLTLADSLGELGVHPELRAVLEQRMGLAGIGLDEVKEVVQSGTVTDGTTNTPRDFALWGSGRCRLISSGAVLRLGDQDEDGDIIPFRCTDASFYFPVTVGGGTILLETSIDEGSSWTTIEAAIDTSTGSNVIVHTETFSELPRLFRLTASGGDVEFIGSFLRNKNRKGLSVVRSSRGGNGYHQFVEVTPAILNAVLADIDPTAILSQHLEGPTGMAAFGTYADLIDTAAPDADHLVMIDYERDATNTAEDDYAPIYRTEADRVANLQVFETGKILTWEIIDSFDWTNADPVHLDPLAWKFLGPVMAPMFGAFATTGNLEFPHVNQSGGIDRYEVPPTPNARVVSINGFDTVTDIWRWSWDTPTNGENYWQIEKVRSGDANNPLGFHLEYKSGSAVWHAAQWTPDGKAYFGKAASTVAAAGLDATVSISGVSTDSATLTLGHNTASRDLLRFKNTAGTTVATVNNAGEASFASYDIPEYANDAAADADGSLLSGALYKVTGSRVVYQKP